MQAKFQVLGIASYQDMAQLFSHMGASSDAVDIAIY